MGTLVKTSLQAIDWWSQRSLSACPELLCNLHYCILDLTKLQRIVAKSNHKEEVEVSETQLLHE